MGLLIASFYDQKFYNAFAMRWSKKLEKNNNKIDSEQAHKGHNRPEVVLNGPKDHGKKSHNFFTIGPKVKTIPRNLINILKTT
jgi:hypothetical protein